MISLKQARAIVVANIELLSPVALPLTACGGRVLRGDACAPENLPAFARSAMDGYAVGSEDDSIRFYVVGEITPGRKPDFKIRRGECARIFTGGTMPDGATQVIVQENVRREGECVVPLERSAVTHVRQRGEDARRGDLLLAQGTRLGAGEISLLASLGIMRVQASPRVRVAHLVTGDELVAPEMKPEAGLIRDSNSLLVAEFIRQCGGEMTFQERLPDDFALLQNRAEAALNDANLLLVSGGASVGDYDFGRRLLVALGFRIHFEQVNLRPGKPLIFATRGRQAAFILPGNPVSHFVTLHTVVRLALERFEGGAEIWPCLDADLGEDFAFRPDARETLWPARSRIENGRLVARALRWQSSGDVTGLIGVNGLLRVSGGAAAPKAGDRVSVLMLELP